jgi:hypothetical protein
MRQKSSGESNGYLALKKCPAFYGNVTFKNMLTKYCHLSIIGP